MLMTLLAKEIRVHLKTFRFNASLIVTFILVVLSVWVLGNDFTARNNLYNKLSESYSEGSDEIFVPSQIRPVLHKRPTPLSIFSQGKERRLGNTVVFSRWSVPSDAVDHLTNNKITSGHVSYDLTTIFIMVVSLFGLLLTYDSISGERERGTLRFQCAYGLSRASIFFVKFAAGFLVIALPFLISFICGLLVVSFVNGIIFSAEQWLAVVFMIVAGLLYCAVFVALGLLCSAIARRSSSSLVLALLVWSLAVLLVPGAGNGLAKLLAPLHPPEEIEELELATGAEIKQKLEDYRRDTTPRAGQGSWLAGWIVDENVSMFDTFSRDIYEENVEYVRFQEGLQQDRAERIWDTKIKHLVREQEQAGLAGLFGSVSPAQQLRAAFTELSGTGYGAHREFMDECRDYRRTILNDFQGCGYFGENVHEFFMRLPKDLFRRDDQFQARWREYMPYIEQGIPFDQARMATGYFNEPLPDDFVPPFRFRGGGPDFAASFWPSGILALMAILFFFVGFAVFLRYDVR